LSRLLLLFVPLFIPVGVHFYWMAAFARVSFLMYKCCSLFFSLRSAGSSGSFFLSFPSNPHQWAATPRWAVPRSFGVYRGCAHLPSPPLSFHLFSLWKFLPLPPSFFSFHVVCWEGRGGVRGRRSLCHLGTPGFVCGFVRVLFPVFPICSYKMERGSRSPWVPRSPVGLSLLPPNFLF